MQEQGETGSWRELSQYAGAAVVLAGGVLVAATSIYIAASLLPTAVADIGGQQLYAWNITVFMVAQVVGTSLVARALAAVSAVRAYLVGFGLFALGSTMCSLAPSMGVMLTGRAMQGLGAGLLTGLGFAMVYSAFPQRLWTRAVALVSAMYGVGNLVGPAMGGLFAQFGSWRLAFAALAMIAAVIAVAAPRVLRASTGERRASPVPFAALGLVVATAAAISVAGLFTDLLVASALIVAGFVLAASFVFVERRSSTRLLPGPTYQRSSPLRWIYMTIMLLAAGVAVEMFLPLFGQRLGGLSPAVAGLFAAALSLGWSLTQILSSTASGPAVVRALQLGGPAVLAAGFALLALLQQPDPSPVLVFTWLPVAFVAGAGIGAAMPHLSVAAMTTASDPGEGGKAASSIATVLTMATALGAAVAGLLVNLGGPDLILAVRLLLIGFAAIAALAIATAWAGLRAAARSPRIG